MVTTKDIPPFSAVDIARFWAKVAIKGPDECWEWQGATNGNGYGHLTRRGSLLKAHRVSYVLANGPYPIDKPFTLHSCDNGLCVNPAHLEAGTYADNVHDKQQKGRGNQPQGEAHARSKLTDNQVIEIRNLHRLGTMSIRAIGRQFSVSHNAVLSILNGKYWSHI